MFARGRKASTQQSHSSKRRRDGRFFRPSLEGLELRTLPSISSAITSVIGGQPTAARIGDFNGDGTPDLVAVNPSTDAVTIALSTGNATFGNAVNYPAGPGARAVAVADLNGDHKLDLIVADYGTNTVANSGGVSVLLGNGDGTFQSAAFIPTGSQPRLVIARDFNGDGKMDIALASDYVANFTTGGSVDVLLNNGNGFSSPVHYAVPALPNSLVPGDFNGDGKLDLAVASAGAAPLSLLLGRGDGTFPTAINSGLGGITPVSLTGGDFNGDGKTELAMIDGSTDLVVVILRNGDGTFQTPVAFDAGPATRVVAADATGDGKADLIVVGGGLTGDVAVAAGRGDGSFLPPVPYAAGVAQPDGLAIADFNGDGRTDLAAISSVTGSVSVLLNLAPAQLQFSAATYTVHEGTPTQTITVKRSGGVTGTVTVLYATSDGSAHAGVNYQATSGSLTWGDGDSTPKTFTIPILDDNKDNGNQTVNLTLSSPGGDATLAGPSTAVLMILNNDFAPDRLLGQQALTGQWWLARPGPAGVYTSAQGTWVPGSANVHWVDFLTGDFNGDGKTDIIARMQETGQWWVGLSTATGFVTTLWATWNPAVTWTAIQVADFNGDGKDDLLGRNQATGQWWVGLSNGTKFTTTQWAIWAPRLTWVDVKVGDLNGDGKMDIVGRAKETGQWWAGLSTGSAFQTTLWATWAPDSASLTWVDVQLGDLTGDGKDDLIGRALQTGQWWAGLSTGTSFTTTLWGHWNAAFTWTDVMLGDLNGDGKLDLVGRIKETGEWWVSLSTGSGLVNNRWGTWSAAATWVNVQLGDFNGDGRMDIIGRTAGSGTWWLATSTGTSFSTSLYTQWSAGITWIHVRAGRYA